MASTLWRAAASSLAGLILAACGGGANVTVGPTAAPATATTALVQIQVDPPTSAPTPTAFVRATLPPEWTPIPSRTPLATETRTPVPTFDMINALLITRPTTVACADFNIDDERTAYTVNRQADTQVAWTAVEGARAYRITLYDVERNTVYTAIIGETEFNFGPTLFKPFERYFWEVRPFDLEGVQLCAAKGALLVPIN